MDSSTGFKNLHKFIFTKFHYADTNKTAPHFHKSWHSTFHWGESQHLCTPFITPHLLGKHTDIMVQPPNPTTYRSRCEKSLAAQSSPMVQPGHLLETFHTCGKGRAMGSASSSTYSTACSLHLTLLGLPAVITTISSPVQAWGHLFPYLPPPRSLAPPFGTHIPKRLLVYPSTMD